MVVDHTHSLQERINDRGTDEAHAPALQVFGDTVRQLCVGARFIIRIQDDFTPRECPEIAVKGTELLLNGEIYPGIADRSLDLTPVADDACISHQFLHLLRAVLGDHIRLEAVKSHADFRIVSQDKPA